MDTSVNDENNSSDAALAISTVWLVTGANRGMGFAYVSQILSKPRTKVIAAARPADDCSELHALSNVHGNRMMIVPLQLSDFNTVQAAADTVQQAHPAGIDYLINNAGVLGTFSCIADQTVEDFKNVLLINVIGTFSVTKAFLPLLKAGRQKTIVHTSSIAASLSNNKSFVKHKAPSDASLGLSYRASKVAINMETTVLANDLICEGFTVVSLHPGEVSTVMWKHLADTVFTEAKRSAPGFRQPHFTPQQSVQAMLHLILALTPEDTGRFLQYDGTEIPW